MQRLSEQQSRFARAILSGDAPAQHGFGGTVPVAQALRIHRNTVIGALVNALRLSYPSVLALVGDGFFEQVAADFARRHPPTAACLNGYGESFSAFVSDHAPSLPYLSDVALLDWAMQRALCAAQATRCHTLTPDVVLQWPVSLSVLALRYPAAEIRSALGDDAALAAIDLAPNNHWLLLWRSGRTVTTRQVGAASAAFVTAMLAGEGAEIALARAAERAPDAPALIQAEIFAASFCIILSGDPT